MRLLLLAACGHVQLPGADVELAEDGASDLTLEEDAEGVSDLTLEELILRDWRDGPAALAALGLSGDAGDLGGDLGQGDRSGRSDLVSLADLGAPPAMDLAQSLTADTVRKGMVVGITHSMSKIQSECTAALSGKCTDLEAKLGKPATVVDVDAEDGTCLLVVGDYPRNFWLPCSCLEEAVGGEQMNTGRALRNFLQGLHVSIPAGTIPQQKGYGFTIEILQLVIGEFTVDRIASTLQTYHLDVHLSGIGGKFAGRVHYKGWLQDNSLGFDADLQDTTVALGVAFERNPGEKYPHGLTISDCLVKPSIKSITFSKDSVVGSVLQSISGLVGSAITSAAGSKVCPMLKTKLSALAAAGLQKMNTALSQPRKEQPKVTDVRDLVEWNKVPVLRWAADLVALDIGPRGMNKIIERMAEAAAGTDPSKTPLKVGGDIPDADGTKLAEIQATFQGWGFQGIDSMTEVQAPDLSDARDPATLMLRVALQKLQLSTGVHIEVQPVKMAGDVNIEADAQIALDLSGFKLDLQATAIVEEDKLPPLDFIKSYSPACLFPALRQAPTFADFDTAFSFDQLAVTPVAVPGTSLDPLEVDIDQLVENVFKLVLREFPEVAAEAVDLAVSDKVQDMVNALLVENLAKLYKATGVTPGAGPPAHCADTDEYPLAAPLRTCTYVFFWLTMGLVLVAWQIWDPLVRAGRLPSRIGWDCLAAAPCVSRKVSVLVPGLVLVNIFLFLWSNASLGADVLITLSRDGKDSAGNHVVQLPPIFDFTLTGTIHELLQAKVYVLAVLVAGFSGLFPYVKLVTLLLAWIMPVTALRPKLRGKMLRWVDMLGKWSLVDAYVMVLFMVSFEFKMPIGASLVHVQVNPADGFFLFVIATLMSMVFGHVVLTYHESATEEAAQIAVVDQKLQRTGTRPLAIEHDPRSRQERSGSVASHASLEQNRRRGMRGFRSAARMPALLVRDAVARCLPQRFRVLSHTTIPFLLVGCLILVAVGSTLDIVIFQYHGLTKFLLEEQVGPGASRQPYSLVTLGEKIPFVTPLPASDPRILALQVVFFFMSFATVFLNLLVLLVAHFIPVYSPFRKTFLLLAHTVHAWAALDVFIISVLASVTQIGQFTDMIVGNKCDLINQALAEFFPALTDEPVCFRVETELCAGTWMLLAAAFVSTPLSGIVVHALQQVSDEMSDQFVAETEPEDVGINLPPAMELSATSVRSRLGTAEAPLEVPAAAPADVGLHEA